MALQLPKNFENDINSDNTSIIPVIGIGTDQSEPIIVSTNAFYIPNDNALNHTHGTNVLPLLKNMPSIRESINFNDKKFKISSLDLQLLNYEYENTRIADIITSKFGSIMNTEIIVWYSTPSVLKYTNYTKKITSTIGTVDYPVSYISFEDLNDDDAYIAFVGVVRNFKMTEDLITLTVEDRSELELNKSLPLEENYTPADDFSIPDKYRGKPKPMVYGYVNNSPCVLGANNNIIIDSNPITGLNEKGHEIFDNTPALFMYDNNKYFPVLGTIEEDFVGTLVQDDDANETVVGKAQWNSSDFEPLNTGFLETGYTSEGRTPIITMSPTRLSALGILQCQYHYKPKEIYFEHIDDAFESNLLTDPQKEILVNNDYDQGINYTAQWNKDLSTGTYSFKTTFFIVELRVSPEGGDVGSYRIKDITLNKTKLPKPAEILGSGNDRIYVYPVGKPYFSDDILVDNRLHYTLHEEGYYDLRSLFGWKGWDGIGDSDGAAGTYDYSMGAGGVDTDGSDEHKDIIIRANASYSPNDDGNEPEFQVYKKAPAIFFYDWCGMGDGVSQDGIYKMYFRMQARDDLSEYNGEYWLNIHKGDFREFDVSAIIDLSNSFEKDFYVNALGRRYYNITFESYQLCDQPHHIVEDLLREIKGETVPVVYKNFNNVELQAFKKGFTVHEPIDARKLIENTLALTPLVGKYDGKGVFNLFGIPSRGGFNEYGSNDANITLRTIKEKDVIKYSFTRTPISEVKTKVVLKYNWDYAQKKYNNTESVEISDIFNNYDMSYYGFGTIDYGIEGTVDDHSKSELVIDDKRGKHIRLDQTGDNSYARNAAMWQLYYSCNQKLVLKFTLPITYMAYSIGDVVEIDKLIGDVKPYGIDYTRDGVYINSQLIFRRFIITKTITKIDSVEIECEQLHLLKTEACGVSDCMGNCSDGADEDDDGVVDTSFELDVGFTGFSNQYGHEAVGAYTGTYSSAWKTDVCGRCINTESNTLITDPNECEECPDGYEPDCAGVCGGSTTDAECSECLSGVFDCAGVCDGTNTFDVCGVCNGDGSSCVDCAGVPNGGTVLDECGVCGGDGSSCADCFGIPNGNSTFDCNDVCNGYYEGYDGIEDGFHHFKLTPCGDCVEVFSEEWFACQDDCAGNSPDSVSYGHHDELCGYCIDPDEKINNCFAEIYIKSDVDLYIRTLDLKIEPQINPLDITLNITQTPDLNYTWQDSSAGNKLWGEYFAGNYVHNYGLGSGRTNIDINNSSSSETDIDFTNTNYIALQKDIEYLVMRARKSPFEIDTGEHIDINILDINKIWLNINGKNHDATEIAEIDITTHTPNDWCGEYCEPIRKITINIKEDNFDFPCEENGLVACPNGSCADAIGNCLTDGFVSGSGDMNNDGFYNVLDIVVLANCVLYENCHNLPHGSEGDLNGDGNFNVLDVVMLANCVLDASCEA